MLGIISGTLLKNSELFEGLRTRTVSTPHGPAVIALGDGFGLIRRHGRGDIPPHMINHKANIWALKKYADAIVGVASVGSLKRRIDTATVVVPDDFLQFHPPTYYDNEIFHATPKFDEDIRENIVAAAKGEGIKVMAGGVYAETRGPRLETKAEVRMLARFADIVGMTAASEATLSCELGIGYAAVCSVDNLAHGLGRTKLTFEGVKQNACRNSEKIEKIVEAMIEART